MTAATLLRLLILPAALTSVWAGSPPVQWQPAAQAWDRSLGTHRVILQTGELPPGTRAVTARMEWRRPDLDPEKKAVIVHDLKSGREVPNVSVQRISGEAGEITFEPVSGAGDYAVYFLPVKIEGGAFPVGRYLPPRQTATEAWIKESLAAANKPAASVARWESLSAQDGWNEMEIAATAAERSEWEKKFNTPYGPLLLEDGSHSVRMPAQIPQRWLDRKPVSLQARPGEYFVFQVVLDATVNSDARIAIETGEPLVVRKAGLPGVRVDNLTCAGLDWNGLPVRHSFPVQQGKVQTFWVGVDIPESLTAAQITLPVRLLTTETRYSVAGELTASITVSGDPVKDRGDANPRSLSRLRWLNSTTAVDDEPVKGYTPLEVKGRTIRCLGRELELGDDGLPVQIRSYFNKAVTKVMETPQVEMLAGPVRLFIGAPATPTQFSGKNFKFTKIVPGAAEWESHLIGEMPVKASLRGRMEFDGSVHYRIALEATKGEMKNEWFALNILRSTTSSGYILGLQQESGITPPKFQWTWDTANKHQDSVWLGAANGGLRLQLKSDNYVRPSVNIHYRRRPLNDPPSWNAGGEGNIAGGMTGRTPDSYIVAANSTAVTLQPGKPLHFDFDLLITPFHPLRTQEQWTERYYHTGGVPQDYNKYLDGAKAAGGNIVNIHQGNWLNPYINYPFLTADKLGAFAKAAHDRGMRAKYYYTVRELSNWCPEIFAFRSMGDEILMSGKGGGHPWGEEHLAGNYWGAWYEPHVQDVSYLTQPMSRFHNYYVEGLRWLCENAGCDGIYLDDISYDRAIMLRARKVLDRYCPRGGRIDLHSWNEFHEGGAWAHCPNIFMDSMPFVDRLWFGEGHHYSGPPPEHFLVEISGIPFGLMGEMLEGGGNPWLGLVHGCTGRLGWGGSPQSVWQLWDSFGVQDAEFIGWWAGNECPVRTADPLVKATVWKKADATLVAVANFSKDPKSAPLTLDWAALGRDPAKARCFFPALAAPVKQKAALLAPDKPLLLKPFSGAVIILDEKPHDIAAPAAAEALGPVLIEEEFTRGLDKSWKPVNSPLAKNGGRLDAGYVLQVPAHVHAYLERALPESAAAVTTRIWQDGNDQGQQWGPGLAVIWPDGKTLRTNVRHDGHLTVSANGGENLDASIATRAPVEFTIRWDKDTVKVFAAGPAMGDLAEELASFPRSAFPGQPSLLRVGKMPHNAGPHDHAEPGPDGFSRIEWVRAFGAKQP